MTKYGKLNNGELELFSAPYENGGKMYYSPSAEEIKGFGFKPIVFNQPEEKKWNFAVPYYDDEGSEIVQKYRYELQPEPDWSQMTADLIRERYTPESETALLFRGQNTQDFADHENYVQECKVKIKLEKKEYESFKE